MTRWDHLVKELRKAANPDCWTAAAAIELLEQRVADKDEMLTLLRAQVAVFRKVEKTP